MYLGCVLYTPAVALKTGTSMTNAMAIVSFGIVCIIYTALGGLKAVIWTDVIQYAIILLGILATLIKVIG